MQIQKAILHILDGNSGITVFSDEELELENDTIYQFLTKHIEKTNVDTNLKRGVFRPDSRFLPQLEQYREGTLEFRDFSVTIAETVYHSIAQSDKIDSSDLIVCDCSEEDQQYIAILKCSNKVGFTHQVVQGEAGVSNEIINHYAILPAPSQKIDECAFVSLDGQSVRFCDKKRSINGQEQFLFSDLVLECTSEIAPRESIKLMNTVAETVAEKFGTDSIQAVSRAKALVMETLEREPAFDPAELGKEIFGDSEAMQEDFVKEIREAGVPERISADFNRTAKVNQNHRIKTDTGIELTFPAEYFQNSDYLKIINNPDGTISIQLNHIGKIINK